MTIARALVLAAAAALLAACAQPAPGMGDRVTLTNRQTGEKVETTVGRLAFLAAVAEIRARNYGRAIAISTQALRSADLSAEDRSLNHTVRAMAHLALNNAGSARLDLDSAIAHDERNSLAWAERGHLNAARGLHAEALADLDRAIALKPSSFAHFERGRVRLLRRDVAGARDDFDAAIGLSPRFASAYFGRGLTHHLAGQLQRAKVDYEQAIAIDPQHRGAREALASLGRRQAPSPLLRPRARPGDVVQF